MEIKLLKLLSGEDVLAEILQHTDGRSYLLRNPTKIIMLPPRNPNIDRNPSIGLAPWAEFAADKEIYIDKSHIVTIMNPIPEFVEQYRKIHSKIITPPIQKIVLPETA